MELTFLGSANAFAADGRLWSSFVVDRKYQFDCPPTLLPQLKNAGVALEDIETIFITHYHGDHFVGLPFLLLEYMYLTPRTKDLYIVGPPGCEDWLEDFSRRVYPNITREAGYRRIYVDGCPGNTQTAGSVTFEAFPMNHVKNDGMKALGYRVHVGDQIVSYTGDTMFCEEIMDLGAGADVFVVDCTYTDGSGPEHMGIDDIKVIRERLSADTTIVLTHMNAVPTLNGALPNTLVAEDLKTFTF